MNFLCIVPARKNSIRVKNKNILKINNKPLIEFTFDQIKKTKYLDKVIVSTDSETIRKLSIKNNIDCPFLRPKNISTANSSSFSVIKHAYNFMKKYKKVDYKYIVLLQPTSPLRLPSQIDDACRKILKNKNADCLVSTCRLSNYVSKNLIMIKNKNYIKFVDIHKYNKINDIKNLKNIKNKLNYIDYIFDKCFIRNGPAIIISKTKNLNNFLLGGKILNFEMPLINSLDINTKNDINYLNNLLKVK